MHERAPVSQDTSRNTLTTKPSNSPHRIEPVSSTCVPEGETGKSTCKLCLFFHTCSLSSGPLFSSTLLQQELKIEKKLLNDIFSWANRPISKQFHRIVPRITLYENCQNGSTPLNKMAARAKKKKKKKKKRKTFK